jgi:hypothetical protein
MMTIFGALIFFLIVLEVISILQSDKLEDGRSDHRQELAESEKHSFANIVAVQTG